MLRHAHRIRTFRRYYLTLFGSLLPARYAKWLSRSRSDRAWSRLHTELDRWKLSGRTVKLWLRDDDAVKPTPALDRLMDLSTRCDVPMIIAVIPKLSEPGLAERLLSNPQIFVAVHGWSHENHAPPMVDPQELGPHRPKNCCLIRDRTGS